MAIELESFAEPWPREAFSEIDRDRSLHCRVAIVGDAVAGFVVYRQSAGLTELQNLAVAEGCRREGVATKLLEAIEVQPKDGFCRIVTRVKENNFAAQSLLKKAGFRAVRIDRSFYETGDDAYQFQKWDTTEESNWLQPANRLTPTA